MWRAGQLSKALCLDKFLCGDGSTGKTMIEDPSHPVVSTRSEPQKGGCSCCARNSAFVETLSNGTSHPRMFVPGMQRHRRCLRRGLFSKLQSFSPNMSQSLGYIDVRCGRRHQRHQAPSTTSVETHRSRALHEASEASRSLRVPKQSQLQRGPHNGHDPQERERGFGLRV